MFDTATVGVLLLVAIGVGVVAIILALVALLGQRRVRAAYAVFAGEQGDRPGADVLAVLRKHVDEVVGLRDDVRSLRRQGDDLRGRIGACISRVHTVRYDAFDDMGGRLSFSTALLDEQGDGVVVTSINGRSETRTYAKPVRGATSPRNLSEEEQHAIRQALANESRGTSDHLQLTAPGLVTVPPAAPSPTRDAL